MTTCLMFKNELRAMRQVRVPHQHNAVRLAGRIGIGVVGCRKKLRVLPKLYNEDIKTSASCLWGPVKTCDGAIGRVFLVEELQSDTGRCR